MDLNSFFVVSLLCFFMEFAMAEEWTHHAVLDGFGKYNLYWTPPEDINGESEIMFKVEVQAKGFVGFGLSPTGGMTGADIVTGWVKDGKSYFQVRCHEKKMTLFLDCTDIKTFIFIYLFVSFLLCIPLGFFRFTNSLINCIFFIYRFLSSIFVFFIHLIIYFIPLFLTSKFVANLSNLFFFFLFVFFFTTFVNLHLMGNLISG